MCGTFQTSKFVIYTYLQILLLVGLGLNITVVQCGQTFKLEAENYSGNNFVYRDAASHHKTVIVGETMSLTMPFCLPHEENVSVQNIWYTNDGVSKHAQVFLDSAFIGEWTSHNVSEEGFHWNSLYEVGQVGYSVHIGAGQHAIVIHITSGSVFGIKDLDGIEIDAVLIGVEDDDINWNNIRCLNTTCVESITYADRHKGRTDIAAGKIVQMSKPTRCLEENNIKIPIYHDNVEQFRITALPPRYRTFWNYKDAEFEGCLLSPRYYWRYVDIGCSIENHVRTFRQSQLTVEITQENDTCIITIGFNLEGISYGKTDAHIGTILEVSALPEMEQEVRIVPSYNVKDHIRSKNVFTKMEPRVLNGLNSTSYWYFPDFTWVESANNTSYSNLIVFAMPIYTKLESLQLKKRQEHVHKITTIYKSEQLNIQNIKFDFWWRAPAIQKGTVEEMKVYIAKADEEYYKGTADYIVFGEKRTWSAGGDMDQTFVLYQDGAARILPLTPHGLDTYVPFGNDIIIGQADPTHQRPHAPIKKVLIKPEVRTLDIYYHDGGYARLHIASSVEETNITVTDVHFAKDKEEYPFAVFRSTWVEDGRAKVDHVTVDGLPAEHVLKGEWTTRYGTNFVFFRKCISSYNTQSPDYSVEILSSKEVG